MKGCTDWEFRFFLAVDDDIKQTYQAYRQYRGWRLLRNTYIKKPRLYASIMRTETRLQISMNA